MKPQKWPVLAIVLLVSAASVLAQESEEYKLPENPEKVWQEYLANKPPIHEIFALIRSGKEPFRSWAVQEMLGRELGKEELKMMVRLENLNPVISKILWQKLKAVAKCDDWLECLDESYRYPTEVKEFIQIEFGTCDMSNDLDAQRFKKVLLGLSDKYQPEILQKYLSSVRSKTELLAFIKYRPSDYAFQESPVINDPVIKKLIFEYQLTTKEYLELMHETRNPAVISDLAASFFRSNPTEQDLARLADWGWLNWIHGLDFNLIAQNMLVGRTVVKRKEILEKMGLSKISIWCILANCY